MRLRALCLLTCALLLNGTSFSQTKEISWVRKNVFIKLGTSILYNFSSSEAYAYQQEQIVVVNNKNLFDSVIRYRVLQSLSIVDFSVDPRVNLWSFTDKSSISLDFPSTAGISVITVSENRPTKKIFEQGNAEYHINRSRAGMTATFAGLISFNYGYHSTYNNIDHGGFALGLGVQEIIVIARLTEKENLPKQWIQPIGRISFKSDKIGSFSGADITIGFSNGFTIRTGFTFIIGY